MRITVTGQSGQVARALLERAPEGVSVTALGRPALDLEHLETIAQVLSASRPDLIVNAAAFTAVDLAESQETLAMRVNAEAAGLVAAVAAALDVPVIQISTDYVFDGRLDRPYCEDDATEPLSAYGRSKLAGERAVAAATSNSVILRTAWVYSPFGRNFVRTMFRLGAERDEVGVVADQIGCPTSALDIADAIFRVARNLFHHPDDATLRGLFHLAAQGHASWAEMAEAIFAELAVTGGRHATVRRIATADYPTPAHRPANSRLACGRLATGHGIVLPAWRGSLSACVRRLLTTQPAEPTT